MRLCTKLIIFFLLILPVLANGQFQISGSIVDASTQNAVQDAEIFVQETNQLIEVDNKGFYSVANLPVGTYNLQVFSFQYQDKITTIELKDNTIQNIYIDQLSETLTAVQISARREALFDLKRLANTEGTAIYAGKKTEVVLVDQLVGSLASNNARQIYAQVVGLNIYENNDAGLQLNIGGRGLDPNRTANFNTRQNGYDISADVLGYPESYYTPPAEAIKEIQVVRGAASLQYGTQFGGLINFKLRKPNTSKNIEFITRQTTGSNGLFTSFNSLSGQVGKLSYYAYANYKNGNGYRPNSDFNALNMYGYLQYDFTDRTSISAEITYLDYLAQQAGGLTDELFETNPRLSLRERNWFEVNWNLYQLKLNQKIGNESKLSISLFALEAARNALGFRGNPINLNANPITQIDEQDINGNYLSPRDLIKGTFQNWGVETKFLHPYSLLNKKSTLLLGFKYYDANNTGVQGAGSNGSDADFELRNDQFPDYSSQSDFVFPNKNISFFTENIFKLSDQLTITPGIRFEYIKTESDGQYNQVNFDIAGNPISNQILEDDRVLDRRFILMGMGFSYKYKKGQELYANISQNYRSVTFSDIRVVSPTFIIDPDIRDEEGFTADIGSRGRIGQSVSYDLSVFGLLYNDRIGIILDDRANRVRKNIGKAIIYGLESFVDVNMIKLWGDAESDYKLKIFSNLAITRSEFLDSEENNVVGKQLEFIPLVNFKSGVNGGFKDLLASLQFSYLSKQFTDVENSPIPDSSDLRSGVIGEIPSYYVVDLSASYRYKKMTLETGILNLTNHSYFSRRATGYPGPGIIPADGRTWYMTLGYRL